MNPSPKRRFQSDTLNLRNHRRFVESAELQLSLDFALMQYQTELALRTQEQMAGAGHLKMVGALEFIQTFKMLAEPSANPVSKPSGQLNHNA